MIFEKGNKFRFKPGNIPWNKGKTGQVPWNKGKTGIYSNETLKRLRDANKGKHSSSETEFRNGHKFPAEIEKRRIETVKKSLTLIPSLIVDESLAYLLGSLKGDGYITINKRTNAYIIGFQNTRKILVDNFAKSLENLGLNPYTHKASKSKKSFQKKEEYRVIAYSKMFHEWYSSLDMNKLKELLDTKEKMIAFIKGFYEAEGTIVKTRTGFYLGFTNTNLGLLNLVQHLLKMLSFKFHLNGPYPPLGLGKKNFYHLRTSKHQQVDNFINMINPDVKRRPKNGI